MLTTTPPELRPISLRERLFEPIQLGYPGCSASSGRPNILGTRSRHAPLIVPAYECAGPYPPAWSAKTLPT